MVVVCSGHFLDLAMTYGQISHHSQINWLKHTHVPGQNIHVIQLKKIFQSMYIVLLVLATKKESKEVLDCE